jgi:pSer/pThr/pTyr-binding forkhead associated (FHA) protein
LISRADDSTSNLSTVEVTAITETEPSDLPPLREQGAYLIQRIGPEAGSWFGLEGEVITIGRHPDSDIFLNDVTVSRRHAEVRRTQDGDYEIIDVGSLNGTYVDHERVEEARLCHGSEVQIGRFRFLFIRTGK